MKRDPTMDPRTLDRERQQKAPEKKENKGRGVRGRDDLRRRDAEQRKRGRRQKGGRPERQGLGDPPDPNPCGDPDEAHRGHR